MHIPFFQHWTILWPTNFIKMSICYTLHAVPLVLIILMYVRIVTLSKRRSKRLKQMTKNNNISKNEQQVQRKKYALVSCIVASLLFSYVPYIVSWQVDISFRFHSFENQSDLMWVKLYSWIARCMMQTNSCINPLIYAITIPSFRAILKAKFCKQNINKWNKWNDIFYLFISKIYISQSQI